MKAVKDFIKSKLIEVGFKERDIFYFESLDKNRAFKSLDSGYFHNESISARYDKKTLSSLVDKDNKLVKTLRHNLAYSANIGLKLFMKLETLDNRLNELLEKLYTNSAPNGYIARVIDKGNNKTTIYDIKEAKTEAGKLVKTEVVELEITFSLIYRIIYEESIKATSLVRVSGKFY